MKMTPLVSPARGMQGTVPRSDCSSGHGPTSEFASVNQRKPSAPGGEATGSVPLGAGLHQATAGAPGGWRDGGAENGDGPGLLHHSTFEMHILAGAHKSRRVCTQTRCILGVLKAASGLRQSLRWHPLL